MNEVLKTIYERRAVRKYTNELIGKDMIEQLLDAGRMAPSAINQQVWKFYVLTDKEKIKLFSKEIIKQGLKEVPKMGVKKIAKAVVSGVIHLATGLEFFTAEDPVFHGAPVVIFVTAPKDNDWAALDIGMCMQNMMLAAKSLGLDSCPVGFGKFVENTVHYPDLKIPKDERVHIALIVGYGDEKPKVHERKKDNAFFR